MLLFVLYASLRLLIDLALAPLRDRAADQLSCWCFATRSGSRTPCAGCPLAAGRSSGPGCPGAPAARALLVHAAGQAETVLHWRRELVRRKWATFAGRPRRGRPSISEECRELICQLAKENARKPVWSRNSEAGPGATRGSNLPGCPIVLLALLYSRLPSAPRCPHRTAEVGSRSAEATSDTPTDLRTTSALLSSSACGCDLASRSLTPRQT